MVSQSRPVFFYYYFFFYLGGGDLFGRKWELRIDRVGCLAGVGLQVRPDSVVWEGDEAREVREGGAEAVGSPPGGGRDHGRGGGLLPQEAPEGADLHRRGD